MNKPIVATWGTGPTYRNRIKHNIQKAIDTGYDNIMDYIILTDYPEDFDDFRKSNNKIIEILDIHKIRKDHPWSEKHEYIPLGKDEESYGRDYSHAKHVLKKEFSYALNRFSLPKISELGFSKFLMCDCDVDIRYDKIIKKECKEEDFWKEFDTPINTMKGCDLEIHTLDRMILPFEGNFLGLNRSVNIMIQIGAILRYELGKKYRKEYIENAIGPFHNKITQTEGPFRYYNLESSDYVKKYFEVWENAMLACYEDSMLRNSLCGGTYMTIDNIPVAIVNEFMSIKPIVFDKFWHTVNIYVQDRYFFPPGHVLDDGRSLQPAFSLEEFYRINKDHIEFRKNTLQWQE